MRRKLSLLDEQTGELINMPIYLNSPHRRSTIYGDRWFQMAQDPLLSMAQDRELRGLTTTVLLYLFGRLDFENYVLVSHQDIADCISTTRPEATRAVNKLIEKRY